MTAQNEGVGNPTPDTQWARADRAAMALQAYGDQVHGPCWDGYGDEGSDEFDALVLGLLVDLKHLLFRADPSLMLTDLTESAVERWANECEALPEGVPDATDA